MRDLNVVKVAFKRKMGLINEEKTHVTRPNSRGQNISVIQQNGEQVRKLLKLNIIKVRWSLGTQILRLHSSAGVMHDSIPK